jgi:hypothetical protein
MKLKIINNWEGLISLLWISSAYFLLMFLSHYALSPTRVWLFVSAMFVGWWGVSLIFAISGLRHGHLASRVCAALTIGIVLYFAYEFFIGTLFAQKPVA